MLHMSNATEVKCIQKVLSASSHPQSQTWRWPLFLLWIQSRHFLAALLEIVRVSDVIASVDIGREFTWRIMIITVIHEIH